MPLEEGQLERQRQYIRNNPRNRLLRMSHRDSLSIHRGSINTALTPSALKGYLQRECGPFLFNDDIWSGIKNRLLITNAPVDNNTPERGSTPADNNTPERSSTPRGFITCDSYGDSRLLGEHLLPVVCHRKDKALHARQKEHCLAAANKGAVLVSARIAEGERDIINTAIDEGFPVVTIEDNGLAERYHPSEQRSNRCADGLLLIASPWKYAYRHADDGISVAECKTMNCIVQAICRTKDSWWKAAAALSVCILLLCSCQKGGRQTRDNLFQAMDLGKTVNVSCFEIEPNGSLWMGLDGEGLAYKESATATASFYNKLQGTLPSDVVICNYRDSRGRLWFGTFGDGLFCWDNGKFQRPAGALGSDTLRYIGGMLEDRKGQMWIATLNNGLALIDTLGRLTVSNMDNSGLATNYIVDLKTFDRHTVYVATGWGLFVLDTDTGDIQPLTDHRGSPFLEKQLVRALYPDGDGRLWIGTRTGLYIYHRDTRRYSRLTTDDGLADDYVKAIGSDKKGHYWISSDRAVTQIVPTDEGNGGYLCHAYGKDDGIGDAVFHVRAIACDANGRMLFGHSKGVLMLTTPRLPATTAVGPSWAWYLLAALCAAALAALATLMVRRRRGVARQYAEITPSRLEISSVDEQFKAKAIRTVEEHIDDADFSVEQLSAALGMSRGHLYKRLLAITGKTPIEFIRTIRIKQGRQLLEESGEGVAQVAWRIGMSPKQFSKYFKEEYGCLPSELKKQPS